MLRAVIYCRCSTEEESQQEALLKQVEESRQNVAAKGWLLVDEYIEARSGTTTAKRREYNRLFEDILEDKFDIIQIKAQDRLMRNTRDWYLFIDRLVTNGKKLYIYLEQKFYSADDALITGIKAILAEEYSKELSKKINHAHCHRQKDGKHFILPEQTYGLQKTPDGEVVLVQEETEAIRLMFRLCKSMGCYSIAHYMEENGYVDRNGKPFREEAIRRIIRNPIRCGTVVQNKVHFDFQLKKTVKVPQDQWVVHKNAVPAVVSEQEWREANEAMDKRAGLGNAQGDTQGDTQRSSQGNARGNVQGSAQGSSTGGRNPGKYPLSGKLVCGECKSPFYRTSRRQGKNGKLLVEWKCREYLQHGRKSEEKRRSDRSMVGRQPGQGCDNIHLEEARLYPMLEKLAIRHYEVQGVNCQRICNKAMEIFKEVQLLPGTQDQIMSLQKEQKKYGLLRKKLLDKLLEEVISDEEYKYKKEELDSRLQRISEKIEGLHRDKDASLAAKQRLEVIRKQLDTEIIKKAFVEALVDRIETIAVYPEKLLVSFRENQELSTQATEETGEKCSCIIPLESDFCCTGRREMEAERIVGYMKECPTITARQIAEKESISLSAANARIRKLKKQGRIHFEGAGGHGKWAESSTALRKFR